MPMRTSVVIRARMEIEREGTSWALQATLETSAGISTRRLQAKTCDELVDAAVLLVTLAEESPAAQVGPPEGSPEPQTTDASVASSSQEAVVPAPPDEVASTVAIPPLEAELTEPVSTPVAPPGRHPPLEASSRPRSRPSRPSIQGTIGAFAGAAGSAVPAPTGWLALEGGFGRPRWETGLGIDYWIGRAAELGGGAEGRFDLVTARIRGCGVPAPSRVPRRALEFPLCGGIAGGAIFGQGTAGLAREVRAIHPWVGAFGTVGLRWWFVPRWGLIARVDVSAAFAPPDFVVVGLGTVCCNRVGVSAALGVVVRMGS